MCSKRNDLREYVVPFHQGQRVIPEEFRIQGMGGIFYGWNGEETYNPGVLGSTKVVERGRENRNNT